MVLMLLACRPAGEGTPPDDTAGCVEGCGWAGTWTAGAADAQLWSTLESADAGLLLHAGDVDGDGVRDLVVTAPTAEGLGGGWVVPGPVASGALDAVGWRVTGTDTLPWAGRAMAVGDLDGDGVDDVGWGAPYGDTTGVFVTLGPIRGDVALDDAAVAFVGGDADAAGHGADLADVTGDGVADAVIGAYYADAAANNGGGVYVFEGPVDAGTFALADADGVVAGGTEGELVGRFLRAGRDVDGDGIGDLLVGAPYIDGSAPGAGGAYVVLGPPADGVFDDAAGLLLGTEPSGHAGLALAQGDLDGDGLTDAILASDDATGAGVVSVVFGPARGEIDLAAADVVVIGDAADQRAGAAVAAGDVDGDGDDELLVGGKGDATAGLDAGAAWLFVEPRPGAWSVAEADAVFHGVAAGDALGEGLTLEELTGDGRADVLLGAPTASTGGWMAGAVYVFGSP